MLHLYQRVQSTRVTPLAPANAPPGQPRPAHARSRAFSLIELLVVVAVVALLVGLLAPALASARRAAKATKCLTQLRSLEQAHGVYAEDHNGRFVAAALAHGGVGDPRRSWPVALAEYAGGPLILRSPGDDSPAWPTSAGGTSADMPFERLLELATDADPANDPPAGTRTARFSSYGLNNYLTPNRHPPREMMRRDRYDRLDLIPSPSSTVHFLMMNRGHDGSPFAVSDHVHAEGWSDGPPGSAPAVAGREMDVAAWGGTVRTPSALAHYAFPDGHAAALRFADVYTDFDKNRFDPESAR